MNIHDDIQLERRAFSHVSLERTILQVFIPLILKNWYWFVFALVVALVGVRFYMNHTMPVYRTSATILINETGERSFMDNSEILQGLGLPGGMRNVQNQIMILSSIALTESTLKELPFEVEYYFRTIRNILPIYPETPVKVIADADIPLPRDTEFFIEFMGNNMISVGCESDYYPFQKTTAFGEEIIVNGGSFRIECRNEEWVTRNLDRTLYFNIHSRKHLVEYFVRRINVELMSRDGISFKSKHVRNKPPKGC